MNLNDLPEHIRKLNPHLYLGGVESSFTKQAAAQALERPLKKHKGGKACVVVSFVRYGRRLLDGDNLQGSIKPLRDAIAGTLLIDDGDSRIRWEYGQIETTGQPGVMVKIEAL